MVLTRVALAAMIVSPASAEPCRSAPAKSEARAMALELVGAKPGERMLGPAGDAEFPAVSADGTLIVQLFHDAEDFSAIPITRLVVWSARGRKAEVTLGGYNSTKHPPDGAPEAQWRAYEDKALATANAQLAGKKWQPLATYRPCDDAKPIDLDNGVTVAYDADADRLTLRRSKSKPITRVGAFPAPGGRTTEGGGGTCGQISGIDSIFGGRPADFVIVVPRAQLGGDSCIGSPTGTLAIAQRIP